MPRRAASRRALRFIAKHCDRAATAQWRAEIALRLAVLPAPLPHDHEMMRRLCVAIAYSQGARSAQVSALIEKPVFQLAFAGFEPEQLSRMSPSEILRRFWKDLGYMRYRGKVGRIVRCAEVLQHIAKQYGSFAAYLEGFSIPRRLRGPNDVDVFWEGFNRLQRSLCELQMPFFRSTTSLLQLLLDLDYDSVKPDLIIMRLAKRIGLVASETGDSHLRQAVRAIQDYSVHEGFRAPFVDLQMLAFGGQSGAARLLSERFCPPSSTCRNTACLVGAKGLCSARPQAVVSE